MEMSSDMAIRASGSASLDERGELSELGSWTSTPFLESGIELEGVSLCVSTVGDCEDIEVELLAFHIPGKSGDRVFHMKLTVVLPRQEQVALHRYLGFLLGRAET